MTSLTIQLDDEAAEALRRLAAAERRSEAEIVRTALAAYVQASRPLPTGVGRYHSGRRDVAEQARDLIRAEVHEARWP